jgi:hypothetical protein
MRFTPSAKHLYLLALFQLVGGPLVILAVVVFSKLAVQHVPEQGIQHGFASVLQSAEWQEVLQTALVGSAKQPRKSADTDKLPQPPPEKGKFLAITWDGFMRQSLTQPSMEPPEDKLVDLLSAWPHAPPSPPPRWS